MDEYLRRRKIRQLILWLSIAAAIILAVVLFYFLSEYQKREQLRAEELHQLDIQIYEDMRNNLLEDDDMSEKDRELLEKMKNYDFYQKLEENLDTYIAFFGTETVRKMKNDSSNWVAQFFETMKNRYTPAKGINVGAKGSTALFGYIALNLRALKVFEYYDLAVVCYGAHDDPETFAVYYDGLLRSIKNQNSKCEIYCIIEANEAGYNENADTVRQICALYGGICIDMNEYYREHNIDYAMTLDGIVPNAYGDTEYLRAVVETIDNAMKDGRRVSEDKRVNFSTTREFDNYKFVEVSSMKSVGETVFEFSSSGKMAVLVYKIDPIYGNNTKIYVNGKKVLTCDTRYGDSDELGVILISNDMGGMNRIRIEVGTEDNAKNIYGVALSG